MQSLLCSIATLFLKAGGHPVFVGGTLLSRRALVSFCRYSGVARSEQKRVLLRGRSSPPAQGSAPVPPPTPGVCAVELDHALKHSWRSRPKALGPDPT